MIIWEDSGHGGKDPGTSYGQYREKDWALDIGNRITELLKECEIRVKRTRDGDITVEPNKRAKQVRESGAKLCISNHINAGGGLGAEVLISQYNDGKLAREILKNLEAIGLNNRGTKKKKLKNGKDYYFMHRLTGNVTTLIVEYGFMDTKSDREFLAKPENRQLCAEAVVKAICNIEGISYKAHDHREKPDKSKPVSGKTKIRLFGQDIEIPTILKDGTNYVNLKGQYIVLRDFFEALDFKVGWENGVVIIERG